jgi:TPR repeat protein
MFEEGVGVQKDINKAVAWYAKGALAGYSDSLLNLGLMYKEGKGKQNKFQEE